METAPPSDLIFHITMRPSRKPPDRLGYVMSNDIDGFVLPLPKDKIEDYKMIAAKAGAI